MQTTSLSDHCRAVILGSLLGDGSLKIHDRYLNARFSFRHSVKQEEYFLWKVKALKEISGERCMWKQGINGKDGWGGMKLRYQSLALPELTEFYTLTNRNGKLTIRRKWLNMMMPLSLAIWWCDDGSLIVNSRKGVFCTDGFDIEAQKILARYLQKVWNVRVHIGRRQNVWRLWMRSTAELQKFLRIIIPYIPVASMLPKVILLYKDPELQQRWISEIAHLSKFSPEIINKYLEVKKSKWKNFRE